jgi:hypothetical protein
MRALAISIALVGLLAGSAFGEPPGGDGGKKEEKVLVFFLACTTVLPLATFLPGLAFHLLLRGIAPSRTRRLTTELETRFFRSAVVGVVDSLGLFLIFLGFANNVKAIALFAFLLWLALAFVGLHGIARALGASVLGSGPAPASYVGGFAPPSPGGSRPELRELVVGWFVLCWLGWFPVLGWAYALFSAVRGTGAVVLQALSGPEDGKLR